jgi:TetR/AcrR family transcriptional regulator, cholesterol catabolism regulator
VARANSAEALSLDQAEMVSAPARPLSRSQTIRRQKIINVALSMLETRNSEQLQMRDISQSANLALATVYRYFPSKELLLARVFEQWCEGYWTRLARAADGRANTDRLIDLASRSVEAYESHPNILVMISALQLSNDPAVAAVMEDIRERAERFFLDTLEGLDPADAAGIVDVVFAVMGAKLTEWVRGAIAIGEVHRAMETTIRLLLEYQDPSVGHTVIGATQ